MCERSDPFRKRFHLFHIRTFQHQHTAWDPLLFYQSYELAVRHMTSFVRGSHGPREATDPAGQGLIEYDRGQKGLLIGCTYKGHPTLEHLPGSERDVREMEAALREVHFEDVQTLLNEQVTKAAIEQALSGFMVGKEATNGCLYVMLAGHGVLDNAGRSVFCCHDYSEANAFMTSIPLDTVKNMAARIVIKHQVYHLDCCHAGGMGKHRGIDNAWAWSQARKPAHGRDGAGF